MHGIAEVEALRAAIAPWRRAGERIALVPTMGNLHEGHMDLVRRARGQADRVVASIFVNPTQFGPGEDFARYPRTPAEDAELLERHGCDLLFRPGIDAMYPFGADQCVRMHVPGLSDILCGAHRPGHFDGVATVVTRLLNMVQPDLALFGEKDYQQLAVIRRMVADLSLPVRVLSVPTRREPDGLAMSSRNRYLDAAQRRAATLIHGTLQWMRMQVEGGASLPEVETGARARLQAAGFAVDYAEIRRSDLSRPEPAERGGLVALVAARLGSTRLIDNLALP